MIPQSHISKLSNRLFKEQGGRRIQESVLERDYCIAWFLVGLSRMPLRNKLAFKGGTALPPWRIKHRIHGGNNRQMLVCNSNLGSQNGGHYRQFAIINPEHLEMIIKNTN
jgi:hypothetical protein